MSATITLNKNRKNAAIFIAHKVVKTKKSPTEKDIAEAAARHMTNHNPGPAVVAVILAEVKNLLKHPKELPPVAAPLGEAKPKATPVPTPKSKGEKVTAAKATTKPKRKLATK